MGQEAAERLAKSPKQIYFEATDFSARWSPPAASWALLSGPLWAGLAQVAVSDSCPLALAERSDAG